MELYGLNAYAVRTTWCPRSMCSLRPDATFQFLACVTAEAVATLRPLGEKIAAPTLSVCPLKVASRLPSETRQIAAVRSSLAVTRSLPFGLNRASLTGPV